MVGMKIINVHEQPEKPYNIHHVQSAKEGAEMMLMMSQASMEGTSGVRR